jgi:hypothetical protein
VSNNNTRGAQNDLDVLSKEHFWWLILHRMITVQFKHQIDAEKAVAAVEIF